MDTPVRFVTLNLWFGLKSFSLPVAFLASGVLMDHLRREFHDDPPLFLLPVQNDDTGRSIELEDPVVATSSEFDASHAPHLATRIGRNRAAV